MRQTIKLLKNRKRSNALKAYGFGLYGTSEEIQQAFAEIYQYGKASSLELDIDDVDDSVEFIVNGVAVSDLEGDEKEFLLENEENIACAYVRADLLPHEDEHYPKGGLRKLSETDIYYLILEIYYFDAVISQAKREEIMESEMYLHKTNSEPEKEKKAFRARDTRFIVVLNVCLVIACIVLTIICFVNGQKGYGAFMVAFALFFAAWGRKFARAKKK